MTDDEFAAWEAADKTLWGLNHAGNPCRDCTPLFHADMVDGVMCDGRPLPENREPAKAGRKIQYHKHSYAELKAMRAEYTRYGAPQSLLIEIRRAYWRERDRDRRRVVE